MCSVINIDVKKKKVLNNPSAASSPRYLKRALMSEGATQLLLYKAALRLREQPCSHGAVFQRLMAHGNICSQPRRLEKKQGGALWSTWPTGPCHVARHTNGKGSSWVFPVTVICDFTREDLRGERDFPHPTLSLRPRLGDCWNPGVSPEQREKKNYFSTDRYISGCSKYYITPLLSDTCCSKQRVFCADSMRRTARLPSTNIAFNRCQISPGGGVYKRRGNTHAALRCSEVNYCFRNTNKKKEKKKRPQQSGRKFWFNAALMDVLWK